MVRVVLVDDHPIVLEGLVHVFSSLENIEVVAQFSESNKVVHFLQENECDLVVSDLQMPDINGFQLLTQLRLHYSHIKCILITMSEYIEDVREALKMGVDGFVLKKANRQELEQAVKTVMSGAKYFSAEVLQHLANFSQNNFNQNQVNSILQLTKRELEILKLISEEYSSQEIADKLFISLSTVETHRRNLMQKLQVKNLAGLVKYAIKLGLA